MDTLRKHAYSNILKTLQPKRGNFPIKNSDIFHISAQNIDCSEALVRNVDTLRKHAYSNILKTLQPKRGNFPIKNSDIFHISAQNIDCWYSLEPPRRGGSNEYPQSMF